MVWLIALLIVLVTGVLTYLIYLGTGLQVTELIVAAGGLAVAAATPRAGGAPLRCG